tara:strand:+ start:102 stop:281 length:180 start_codon:yes stop_codon:yes gene_type:complete
MRDNTKQEDYFRFLEELRESGMTNMFGAVPLLEDAFPELNLGEAKDWLIAWMDSFYEED